MWQKFRELFTPKPLDATEVRRYASLVLAEVTLYNKAAIDTLRSPSGPSKLLKDSVERAWAMYEKRAGSSQDATTTFREEAVRILAGGDAALIDGLLSRIISRGKT